jgi:hypothetical protein
MMAAIGRVAVAVVGAVDRNCSGFLIVATN